MKNTKMRKKMLLSSIAMLMVATVSLGSATYAWFMQNPNADASGLVMKASASKGLVILTESHKAELTEVDPAVDFKTTDYLNFDKDTNISKATSFVLSPASMDVTANTAVGKAYTTTASSNTEYVADDLADVTAVEKGYTTQPVYKESIFCALTGATSDTDVIDLSLSSLSVKFNANASALKKAIRVVVAFEADGATEKVLAAYALPNKDGNNATNAMLIGNIAANTKYGSLDASNKGTLTCTSLSQVGSTNEYRYTPTGDAGKLGSIGQDGLDKVNVYVYLDGEDENCYSQVVNASDIIDEVKVNLSVPV